MRVAIRADASTAIGTGHIIRCLTLAEGLRSAGVEVIFLCQDLAGNLFEKLEDAQFKTYSLPATDELIEDITHTRQVLQSIVPIDYLIVDHYKIDAVWHREIRSHCKKLCVIDDLADRNHDCDLLLDQTLLPNKETRYQGKVPSHCEQLLGFEYLLLRSEFLTAQQTQREAPAIAKRVLITMGGSDPFNATFKILESLKSIEIPLEIRVAIGKSCPHFESIQYSAHQLSNHSVHLQIGVTEMAEWMNWADMAICAGGSTIYELAYIGVPTLVATVAETQIPMSREMHRLKFNYWLGMADEVTIDDLSPVILEFIEHHKLRQDMIQVGQGKIDGQGTQRVIDRILKMI